MRATTFILAVLLAGGAFAQTRPTTTAMTCAQAAGLVLDEGALVLNTGPYTYDRYVSGGQFCARGETTEPAWVPSADSPQCFIGYRCRGISPRQSGR